MADPRNRARPNVVRTVSIVSLVVVLLLFVWSLFNQHEVMCSVFGYRYKEVPLFYVMLWSFLAGGAYVAVVWGLCAVRSRIKTRSLKRTVQELTERLDSSAR